MPKKLNRGKRAIVIFGYPGSGKSTQAVLLAEKFGLYHFNTGRFVENLVHDPELASHPDIQREKKLFDTGKLMDSDFVLSHTGRRVKELAKGGESIVFSGSPRALFDAFGDKKHHEGIIDILMKLYGEESVLFVLLKVTQSQALARNSHRLMCSVCQSPLLGSAFNLKITACPFCGGKLYKRTLDDPKTIRVRFAEYEEKTAPIIQELQKRGFVIYEIGAHAMPHTVFHKIAKLIS
ncbi:MAG: nucleoside monophosphate kinase [Candidatus Paceibacterota bacterium]